MNGLAHGIQRTGRPEFRSANRRQFLGGAGSLLVAFSLSKTRASAQTPAPTTDLAADEIDSWIKIDGSGEITLCSGKVEIGQGILTAFTQIAAEELDVALSQVTVIQGDTFRTPDQGVSSASRSIAVGGPQVRAAAAEARLFLLTLAAEHLGAQREDLKVKNGVVYSKSNSVSYGALIGGKQFNHKVSGKAPLKNSAEYKIVGTSIPRLDIPDKVFARFDYVQDVKVPGMYHGRVIRPPVIGASLLKVEPLAPTHLNVSVIAQGNFLAVVAPTEWGAISAARELKAHWSPGIALSSHEDLANTLRSMPTADVVTAEHGSLADGQLQAAHLHAASYIWPFQSHGSIGPSCAVADVKADGTATIWSATQDVYKQREAVARLLGSSPSQVRIVYVEGSGCYGHNGSDDANGDAALLSKAVGRPVRVQWTRQDEHGWAPRGAPFLMDLRAGLDQNNKIVLWDVQIWALTHSARYRNYGKAVSGYLLASQLCGKGADVPLIAEPGRLINFGAVSCATPNYDVANTRTLVHGLPTKEPHPLRPSELRSVSGLAAVFSIESFIDELAVLAGEDPIAFRLNNLKDARSIRVLREAAQLANWQIRKSPNSAGSNSKLRGGRGVATAQTGTYVALVADVEVDITSGEVHVRRLSLAHDCGAIVNPDGLRNQIEGNLIQATSRSLKEEVKWDATKVTTIDWQSYPILTFPDLPELRISLIENPHDQATGAGEPSTWPVAAAISNAIFDAVRIRLKGGPFTPQQLLPRLGSPLNL